MEFFKGLSRSLGTKIGILLLPPTLDVQSVSVHANNSKFPKESTVQHIKPANSSRYSRCTSTNATCQSRITPSNMGNLLKKASPNWPIQHILRKPLITTTHQSTLHLIDIPAPNGIHHIEQIRHSNTTTRKLPQKNNTPHWVPIVAQGWSLGH